MQTHMFLKQTKEWIIQPQLFSSKTGWVRYANKHFRSQSESSITLCLFFGKSWSSLSFDSLFFFPITTFLLQGPHVRLMPGVRAEPLQAHILRVLWAQIPRESRRGAASPLVLGVPG